MVFGVFFSVVLQWNTFTYLYGRCLDDFGGSLEGFASDWHVSWNMVDVDLRNIEMTTFCGCLHGRKVYFGPYHGFVTTKGNESPSAKYVFYHFEQKLNFAYGTRFYVWRCFQVKVDLQTYHNTIFKVFVDHWDHKECV